MTTLSETLFNQYSQYYEEFLNSSFAESPLDEACVYALRTPGKRIRPLLSLAVAELLQVEFERILPFALSVECIHCFSLVHDDLPALDNDTLRRGLPTVHCEFDEATAILAGDALMAKAFNLLATAPVLSGNEIGSLVSLLSEATWDMCLGQKMDLDAAWLPVDDSLEFKKLLERRHLKKTGALLRASVVAPTYLYHAGDALQLRQALSGFGLTLGLLFQVVDDILGATSETAVLGKSAGADERQGTPTYVTVYGIETATSLANELHQQCIQELAQFGSDAQMLRTFVDFVRNRTK